ncbi:MAG: DUF308 domain-containing protein [Bradyrhizobium sp.]
MAKWLARAACAAFGVALMMIALLLAGICVVLVGAAAIVFGIPVREFSFGNTMILVGTVALCSGLVVFAQLLVVRELRNLARRLLPPVLPPRSRAAPATSPDGEEQSPRDQGGPAEPPGMAPPWREDAAPRERAPRQELEAEAAEAAPQQAPKRHNVLFSSTLRRDRERAQARLGEPAPPDRPSSPSEEPAEARPPGFDEAWPRPERSRGSEAASQRRGSRASSGLADAKSGAGTADHPAQGVPGEGQSAVTVVKSGVVDGMAYSLYSDGSIEAQMPEGMMRFASIDELRAHLDQRP